MALLAAWIDARWGQSYSLRWLVLPPLVIVASRFGSTSAIGVALAATAMGAAQRWQASLGSPSEIAWEATVRFGVLATLSMIASRSRRSERHHESLAGIDELTQLLNRRGFQKALATASRGGSVTGVWALLFFDVDHLKTINDLHGHAAGDRALQSVASALRAGMRQGELIARWGGDECLCVVPGASEETARRIVDRCQRKLDECPPARGASHPPVTMSVGVAVGNVTGDSIETLLLEADQALLRAKSTRSNPPTSPGDIG